MATDPGEKPTYWALDPRRCDTCRAAPALLFCAADSAFFCNTCDARVHAASRHPRVWICEVCEQAPASVTCKADAAVLCAACDADIHTANPLARRHERVPLAPFFDVASAAGRRPSGAAAAVLDASEEAAAREAAASWLVLDPGPNLKGDVVDLKRNGNYFQDQDMDPYLDHHLEYASSMEAGFDCVVPIVHGKANVMKASPQILSKDGGGVGLDFAPSKNSYSSYNVPEVGVVPDGEVKAPQMLLAMDAGGMDRDYAPIKQSYTGYSMSASEVGVVPDGGGGGGGMVDVTNPYNGGEGEAVAKAAAVAAGMDREARVMRYREKRKSRRFEKTIRYASRKAYAETRPRIKGRFAKRTEMEVVVGEMYLMDRGYGVVPSF